MKTGNNNMYMPHAAYMHVHAIGQMGVACHRIGAHVCVCVCVAKPVVGRQTHKGRRINVLDIDRTVFKLFERFAHSHAPATL